MPGGATSFQGNQPCLSEKPEAVISLKFPCQGRRQEGGRERQGKVANTDAFILSVPDVVQFAIVLGLPNLQDVGDGIHTRQAMERILTTWHTVGSRAVAAGPHC